VNVPVALILIWPPPPEVRDERLREEGPGSPVRLMSCPESDTCPPTPEPALSMLIVLRSIVSAPARMKTLPPGALLEASAMLASSLLPPTTLTGAKVVTVSAEL